MTTLVVYPDAGTGNTTVDGPVARSDVNETFSSIGSGDGTYASATIAQSYVGRIVCSSTSNQFSSQYRAIFTFDTSSLTSGASISSAVFSLWTDSSRQNGAGEPAIHVCASTPNANNALQTSDYGELGSTSFGNIAYADWSESSEYNDFTLNASGISNISKTGISRFGTRLSWDIDSSFGGTWSSGQSSGFLAKFADESGTTSDPKLTIEYTVASPTDKFFMLF